MILPRPATDSPRSAQQDRTAWIILLAALAMTVLEGAFRKWVPPFQGGIGRNVMYFSKDLIFASLLLMPRVKPLSAAQSTYENWLVPGCVLLSVGSLASCLHGVNIVGALLSAKALILLPWISWLAMPRLAGLPLRWVLWLLLACTVLNFALGTEQNRLPSDHILNHYADADMQVVAMESGVRATGTFSYIAGLALICAVGVWVGMAMLTLARSPWENAGAWVALATGIGCGLASISRAPIATAAIMFGGWMVGARIGLGVLSRGLLVGAGCLIPAYYLGLTSTFTKLGEGLIERQAGATDSFNERAFGQIGESFNALTMYPLGNGFGSEQGGGQYYATGEPGFNHFENELPRLVMESGVLGLAGFLVVCFGAILALQAAKKTAAAEMRPVLLATQIFLIPLFYGGVIFNHVASAFAWLIFTAVMACRELNPEISESPVAEITPQPRRRRPRGRQRGARRASRFLQGEPITAPESAPPEAS